MHAKIYQFLWVRLLFKDAEFLIYFESEPLKIFHSMFGDPREMELHYFLADDTIEIVEKIPPNSGRDAVSMFLRRAKLPREPLPVYQPGVATSRTVLNVFGPTGHGGRYLLDSLKVLCNSQNLQQYNFDSGVCRLEQ